MTKQASPKYAPEVRERAVRMVFDHAGGHASQWAAIGSIEILRKASAYFAQAEFDRPFRK